MDSHVKIPHLKPADPQGADLLAAERARATFKSTDLSLYMYGKEFLDKLSRVLAVLENDPAFDKSDIYYLGRTELFKKAVEFDKKLVSLSREHGWDLLEFRIASVLLDLPGPFSLHRSMFMPTLYKQATQEQKEAWLIPSLGYEIIGCYAQTELGHGSNVQGLETTATYILETNEFEIHTPTLTATKWWIGNLGASATHAIVMARLISNKKDYGPHAFVIQIRDLETHKPLPGISVGDVGPKFGFNSVDNGFVVFDHVRVPHLNMLARFSQIVPGTGEYKSPPNTKLSYGTMVFVRAYLLLGARNALARAATIAIRYSAIRQQFVDKETPFKLPDGKVAETPVLDYTMQQYRLLPIIAQTFAVYFTTNEMLRLYEDNETRGSKGDFSLLADLHASSSGLKSLCTTMAVDAIEDCRRACGGHGFSSFSGFSHFYKDYLPNTTWEGDNHILTQQTARYLFKNYRELISSKYSANDTVNPTVEYIAQYLRNPSQVCSVSSPADFKNPELQLTAFGHRAAYLIANAVDQIDNHNRSWNSMLVDIYAISRAHCQFILLKNFVVAVQQGTSGNAKTEQGRFLASNPSLGSALGTVCNLFALHTMEKELGEFLASGYLTGLQSEILRIQIQDLLQEVRPNAVALVDGFHIPDYLLHSALGRSDGRVYETMMEWAAKEPLNSIRINIDIESDQFLKEGQDQEKLRSKL